MQIKHLLLSISILTSLSCSSQKKAIPNVIILQDSIQSPYAFLNEIKIVSSNSDLSNKLNESIQKLSENKEIKTSVPEERLAQKKQFCNDCLTIYDAECKYTPEGYKILSNKNNILNVEYGYNYFMSYDNWLKYACFDLIRGEQLTYDKMFVNADELLENYNEQYVSIYENILKNNNQVTGQDLDEYNLYASHLEDRVPFELEDLNNIELIYDTNDKINEIRFHYSGIGGNHGMFFPNDYIPFSFEELKPYLSERMERE